MIPKKNILRLRQLCFSASVFPPEVLNWIKEKNLWNIWVPKVYGGLELSLTEGLHKLKELAKIDASLGWTITLCSGANYFIGNLQQDKANEIFLGPEHRACLGGSGGVFGTAEKIGNHYEISGTWRYATGAPYLTHFTLNAEILVNGNNLRNKDGSPIVKSFVVPKEEVEIIEDWNTMGLKASATHSFQIKNVQVDKNCSFTYNEYQLPQPIFKIHFSLFADLTLWVNYIGMAEHFMEEAIPIIQKERLRDLERTISISNQKIGQYAEEIEKKTLLGSIFETDYIQEIHMDASNSVKELTRNIIEIYPLLGVQASRKNHQLNQIFCDYFTATQHHIFTKN